MPIMGEWFLLRGWNAGLASICSRYSFYGKPLCTSWNVAAAWNSSGTLGYTVGSNANEKVIPLFPPDPPGNSIQERDNIRQRFYSLDHEHVMTVRGPICVFIRRTCGFFFWTTASFQTSGAPTLCPNKPIPNLCLTSCQDHMTPRKPATPPAATTTELFRARPARLHWPTVPQARTIH